MLGRNCFYHALKFINKMKTEILDAIPVFQEPITEELAFQICSESTLGKSYKDPGQLMKDISAYPLRSLKFALAQKALSEKFNTTLIYKWQEQITQYIAKMIKKYFKDTAESKIVRRLEDLNPFIVRFLKCVQQVEVGHLHIKFKAELTKYLRFLLQFANREAQFRKSPIYRSKDLDKISLEVSHAPLLCIDVGVVRAKHPRTSVAIEGLDQGF